MNVIHPADPDITCAIPGCYNSAKSSDMASLTDKNGQGWQVCPPCVDSMWARTPWRPEETHPVIRDSAEALPALVGAMSVLVDMLRTLDIGDVKVIQRMRQEIDTARKAYNPGV